MSSTFGSLEAARSGLNAAQLGLNITGQNIANANTPGYSRQVLDSSSATPNSVAYRIASSEPQAGRGVDVKGVYQVRNNFLDVSYRNENSQYSMYSSMEDQLNPIQDYFNPIDSSTSTTNEMTGLSGQLDDLYTSLKNAADNPTDPNLSADVESKVDELCQTIKGDANQLSTALTNEKSELGIVVNGGSGDTSNGPDEGGINTIIDNIKSLNEQISSYENATGQQASDLRDQRNNLLDQLSSDVDINVQEQPNGMVTVQLQSDANSGDGNMIISSSNQANHFTVGPDKDGSGNTVLQWTTGAKDTSGNSISGNTANVQGGLVKAYENVINGNGSGTGDFGNVGIPYLQKKLNNFAAGLYNVINNIGGAVSSDTKGTQFVTFDGAPGAGVAADPSSEDIASSISVTSAWSATPSTFQSNYTGSDPGSYFTSYASAVDSTQGTVPTPGSGSGNYSGTLSQYADTFVSDIAEAISNVSSKADSSQTNVNNIDQERQSISSVSTDDEGINIIKYQQAYNASARVVTTIDEMLDKLINGTGEVGLS